MFPVTHPQTRLIFVKEIGQTLISLKRRILLKKQNFICNTKTTETYYLPFCKNIKKIGIRNTLSQIGIMPKSCEKVLNLS